MPVSSRAHQQAPEKELQEDTLQQASRVIVQTHGSRESREAARVSCHKKTQWPHMQHYSETVV